MWYFLASFTTVPLMKSISVLLLCVRSWYMEEHPETGACLTLLQIIDDKGKITHNPEIEEIFKAENRNREVDFDELKAANSDIVGWLYMTTPYISQPVLRSGSDDSYYLSHGANGDYDRNGSLFMEGKYNSADFSDPCTIIYGHRMSDGAMFGNLQASFDGVDIVNNAQYVVIYLPNETKIYHIIATVPYEIKHILYYNDLSNESVYNKFIDKIYATTGSEVQLVTDDKPQYGDKLLILSTCLRTDRTRRFLVIAKEVT